MDNLSHSLIGLIAGEAIARATPGANPAPAGPAAAGLAPDTRRSLVWPPPSSRNAPDADLARLVRRTVPARRLAYLIQHRGYTHTLIGCLVLAALLYAGIEAWMRWRRLRPKRADRALLACVAVFGTGLHLAMDFLNSYGVHPFWPLDDRWVYGDSVYIVEPSYWAATAPLLFVVRSAAARIFLGLTVLVAVVACAASGLVAPVAAAAVIALTACLTWMGRRSRAREAAFAAAAAFAVVTTGFIAAGRAAAHEAVRLAHADFPSDRVLDAVLTPLPANPLCWDALVLQTRGDRYFARHAVVALAPHLIPAAGCRSTLANARTWVPQAPATIREPASLRWREFAMSRADLTALVDGHCQAAALMHFARAPFAVAPRVGAGGGWTVGDLRFVRGATPGFADIRLPPAAQPPGSCAPPPPWGLPRADLLGR